MEANQLFRRSNFWNLASRRPNLQPCHATIECTTAKYHCPLRYTDSFLLFGYSIVVLTYNGFNLITLIYILFLQEENGNFRFTINSK